MNNICKELCVPTGRGFKGFTIVFSIYTLAAFVAALMISQLTEAHLRAYPDMEDADGVRSRNKTMTTVLLSSGVVFGALTVVSGILWNQYKLVLGR